jgi:hypothetical protein
MRIMGLQVIYPKRHLSRPLAGAKVYGSVPPSGVNPSED